MSPSRGFTLKVIQSTPLAPSTTAAQLIAEKFSAEASYARVVRTWTRPHFSHLRMRSGYMVQVLRHVKAGLTKNLDECHAPRTLTDDIIQ